VKHNAAQPLKQTALRGVGGTQRITLRGVGEGNWGEVAKHLHIGEEGCHAAGFCGVWEQNSAAEALDSVAAGHVEGTRQDGGEVAQNALQGLGLRLEGGGVWEQRNRASTTT
jgi:hypothetical protein